MSNSNVFSYLSKKIPGLFSRESVEELVQRDELSWESASSIIADIDTNRREAKMSLESEGVTHKDIADIQNMGIAQDAIQHHFANVKFEALLNMIQKDDTLQYDEFVNIDNARNKIIADIINKHENEFNVLLNEIKTTGGVNAEEVDALLQTKLGVAAVD